MYRAYLIAVFLVSCQNTSPPPITQPVAVRPESTPAASLASVSQPSSHAVKAPPHLTPEEEAKFLEIATSYTQWGRVDERLGLSPLDCQAFSVADSARPAQVRESQAMSEHGQKLYYLFAKKKQDYLDLAQALRPNHAGQIIVKEAWTALEIEAPTPPSSNTVYLSLPQPIPYIIIKDGKALQADKPASLFIMRYVGAAQPNTDNGWWYATVSPDKKTVTASGIIASCQGCHSKAKYQGLFGLQIP
jgi:hypothetical protein